MKKGRTKATRLGRRDASENSKNWFPPPKEGWVGAEKRGIFIKMFLSCLEGVLILLRNSGTLRKMSFYSGILNALNFSIAGSPMVGRSMSITLHRVPTTLTSLAMLHLQYHMDTSI